MNLAENKEGNKVAYENLIAANKSVLYLTLQKKWYDMIASGEKKEEYRDIKPYWLARIHKLKGMSKPQKQEMCDDLLRPTSAIRWRFANHYSHRIIPDVILFRNGHSKKAPTMIVECISITIDTGKPQWGAEKGTEYFVFQLGKVLYK